MLTGTLKYQYMAQLWNAIEEVCGRGHERPGEGWLLPREWFSLLRFQLGQLRFSLSVPFSQGGCYFVPVGDRGGKTNHWRYRLSHTVKGELKLTPWTPNRRLVQASNSPRGKQRVLLE